MMRNDIKKRKRVAPIVCAAVVISLLVVYLAVFLCASLGQGNGGGAAVILAGVCIAALLAVMAGVILALCQRLKEINGGEEEDAKKY